MRQSLPASQPACELPEFLSMRLGDADYVIDLELVSSISPHDRAPVLEGPPSCLRGVRDAQGQFVPLLDPGGLLDRRPEAGAGVIVIVELPQQRIGLLVEAINDVVALVHHSERRPERSGQPCWALGSRGRRSVRRLDLQQLCLQTSAQSTDGSDIRWPS